MIYALWHGGTSYAPGYLDRDLETFESVDTARDALTSRADSGHWCPQKFTYADGRTVSTLTPCADSGASMTVYLADPRNSHDPYPDRILTLEDSGTVTEETS